MYGRINIINKNVFKNQTASIISGTAFVCFLRYVCHVISGCTVWAGLSIPDSAAFVYSLGYNATYMIPETIITIIGCCAIVNIKPIMKTLEK